MKNEFTEKKLLRLVGEHNRAIPIAHDAADIHPVGRVEIYVGFNDIGRPC
jgi:hypothetical protein